RAGRARLLPSRGAPAARQEPRPPGPSLRGAAMRICVFEDRDVALLEPLTLTRPAFDLWCGASSLLNPQRPDFAPRRTPALPPGAPRGPRPPADPRAVPPRPPPPAAQRPGLARGRAHRPRQRPLAAAAGPAEGRPDAARGPRRRAGRLRPGTAGGPARLHR